MKVLFATSELAPWVKTGGLGDVSAALPEALHGGNIDVRILVPAYPALKAAFHDAPMVGAIPRASGLLEGAAIRLTRMPSGVPLYLLECDCYFDRPGNPYLGPEGQEWLDNGARFGLLSRVAALLASADSPLDWHPDILHCNDWQTGLAPTFLNYWRQGGSGPTARSVFTVHNLAFQGIFDRNLLLPLTLPEHAGDIHGVEYHGMLSFLKAGLRHADAITTVSPTYAREIQTPSEGMGLDGLLRFRADALTGIVNGIDTAQWDPSTDRYLASHYTSRSLPRKLANKSALRLEFGLDDNFNGPLLGIVSRLSYQKGLDLLPPIAADLAALPVQLVVLGTGERGLEAAFRGLATKYPRQFAAHIGFDEGHAHRIEAGADLFLMPSRFEPCGLNQLFSLRYGTLPIVRATGGLADTVTDASDSVRGNGFVFHDATPEALLAAIRRAVTLWHDHKAFATLQRRAMNADYSWNRPAAATAEIYRALLPQPVTPA